jgi:low temperature requirement protein LtrA
VVLAAMWWIYFADDSTLIAGSFSRTLAWGYGHYVVFASAAAVSTGVEVQVAVITGHAHVGELAARLVVGVPVAVYVVAVWVLVLRGNAVRGADVAVLAAAVLIVLAAFLPLPPAVFTAVAAGVLVAAVTLLVAIGGSDGRRAATADDAVEAQAVDAADEPA